jgi:hypothetical protein
MGLGTAVGAGRLAAGGAHTQLGVSRAYRWPGLGTPIVFLHGGVMTSVSDAQPAGCDRGGTVSAKADDQDGRG